MFEAHFQSFEDRSERAASAPRLAALRAELKRRGLDGLIVPRADRYQNEYVPPCAEQLAWLTGFTGSAGIAIVLADRAVIFVDGRYLVQVREEVDAAAFTVDIWSSIRRPGGSKRICRPAPGSAIRPGCTPSTAPRGSAKPARLPARLWCRSTTILSTPSGRAGRNRRSVRLWRTICAMPARRRRRSSRACALSLRRLMPTH
jgi:hypothetical protein